MTSMSTLMGRGLVHKHKMTQQNGKNLLLTKFQQFWQLLCRYCS